MTKLQLPASLLCASLLIAGDAGAQSQIRIEPAKGHLTWLTHTYRARSISPIKLANSSRFGTLIRAGNLYLSAQDVVALAIENNIDVEVQRYGPLLAREILRRAESGGVLRSVGVGLAQGPQSVSLQGVSLNSGGAALGSTGVNSGGGILTQLGPVIQSFDPTISGFVNFAHSSIPQSNTVLTGINALVVDSRTYQAQYSQSWSFGLTSALSYSSQRQRLNSLYNTLNPSTNGALDLTVTQNLLQGFGSAVNGRNIRVQRNNLKVTDLQFKQQLITTISAVLNLYWDLVSFNQDVKSRERAVETAQRLLDDNKRQVEIGTIAEIEVTRAMSQLYASKQDLVISKTNLLQQETILKNALSRAGIATSELADIHIIPLDSIVVPEKDEVAAVDELVGEALRNRPEIEQSNLNLLSNHLNLVGIKNSLRPSLQAFAELTNNGLTGDITAAALAAGGAGPFAGGYGNLLGQIFRRNYPNYSAGFSLNIPLRNRAAQSDYATSLIEIRQNELTLQKTMNQIRVDVQNAVIGIQQARARHEAALKSHALAEQTLAADQRKFELGAATAFQVVQDQRDLANAQSSEVQAMANFTHARISLDQSLGRTLEVNGVSVADALKGQASVTGTKSLPEVKQ